MAWEAWVTLAIVLIVVVALVRNIAGPDLILIGGLGLLLLAGVFSDGKLPSPGAAVAGFGNEGLVTVAVLFVVVAGLTQTGAMNLLVAPLLGRPRSVLSAQVRLMLPVGAMSAFLNNTPLVAMFMPVVSDWCKKTGISPSKLFMPLSFATILGGCCTLIGTSTNLVVSGLYASHYAGAERIGMFDIAAVGLPSAVVGFAYILLANRWLLKDRKPALGISEDPRQYTVEMTVEPSSALVGQTIEGAGLRHLPGLYLVEIDRGGDLITAVGPQQKLAANDRLVFVGVVESVVDLQKVRGLVPATNQVFKLDAPRGQRCLVEAVVSDTCPLINKSIREGRFRSAYNAAVIAVARNGKRIQKKVGDIVLQPGDTLLLEAHPSFADQQRNSRDFFLVSRVEGSTPLRHERAPLAMAILIAMVLAISAGWVSTLTGALIAAVGMIVTRCVTGNEARRSIDYPVLLVIGAAFGIGKAMETSGAAAAIIERFLDVAGTNPYISLVMIYVVTNVFTAFMTNNAAAVLVFPLAAVAADSLGVSFLPFVFTIMMAASNDFSTPIGYATNLMVYGPGGYKFSDYVVFGGPLNVLVMIITVILAPMIWPF